MIRPCLLLLWLGCLVSFTEAMSDGAPFCSDLDKPGHGPSEVEGKDPGLGKTKTRSTAEGENRTWFVVINRPEAVLKGILLRPQKGVKGTFMVHDEVNFKTLEKGLCVTHSNNSEKKGPQMFTFKADSDEEPIFDLFVVGEKKEQWWMTSV